MPNMGKCFKSAGKGGVELDGCCINDSGHASFLSHCQFSLMAAVPPGLVLPGIIFAAVRRLYHQPLFAALTPKFCPFSDNTTNVAHANQCSHSKAHSHFPPLCLTLQGF